MWLKKIGNRIFQMTADKSTSELKAEVRPNGELVYHLPGGLDLIDAPEGTAIPLPTSSCPIPPKHGPATGNNTKPTTKWIPSPYASARNGAAIEGIVMHYTAPGSMAGVIDWFTRSSNGICSHYLIGKDGEVIQFVKDGERCAHAAGHNANTIGIEHYSHGEPMTAAQSEASAQLCRYLVAQYPTLKWINGHRFLYSQVVSQQGTDCPNKLFGEFSFASLQDWVRKNVGEKWVPKA